MILGETSQQKKEREEIRRDKLRHAYKTGEYIDGFTTPFTSIPLTVNGEFDAKRYLEEKPERLKAMAKVTFNRLPKCLIRDETGKIQLRKDIKMEPETNQLAERKPERILLETDIDLMAAERHLQTIQKFQKLVQDSLHKGHDFGTIPGTPKPTLYKPGAEKIAKLLGLSDEYVLVEKVQDWSKPFFMYTISCKLKSIRTGNLVSEGIGHCNSMESKYRWREMQRKCPNCSKETIIKGKKEFGGGWICWKMKGGCGAKFDDKAPEIVNQKVGKVENEEIFSQVNTLLKMAKKRALVDAALSAGRLSDLFTQDLEDMDNGHLSSNNQEAVTEFEEKYQTDKPEQPKETMPTTTLASGRPQPTSTQIVRMTKIKELVLSEAKNQGQVGEGREELTENEKNKLANAIWHTLSERWPKNEDDVIFCAQNINPEIIFELKMPEEDSEQ